MPRGFLALGLGLLLCATAAKADSFDVPYEKPALAISVPDGWNPNHSDIGVDAASPDNSVFFSLYVMTAKNAAAVNADSLAMLKRNGMTLDMKSARPGTEAFAGLSWNLVRYGAMEERQPRAVLVETAQLSGTRFAQLAVWGTPAGLAKNEKALKAILATIKLKKS